MFKVWFSVFSAYCWTYACWEEIIPFFYDADYVEDSGVAVCFTSPRPASEGIITVDMIVGPRPEVRRDYLLFDCKKMHFVDPAAK
jgi:hypothetical protein